MGVLLVILVVDCISTNVNIQIDNTPESQGFLIRDV